MIVCVVLPDAVSHIEQAVNASCILVVTEQGVVSSASLPALHAGVKRGMRVREARTICPDASIVALRESPYQELADALTAEFEQITTIIEPISPFWHKRGGMNPILPCSSVAWYLDVGKLTARDALRLADELVKSVQQKFGVCLRTGLAAGKFSAVVASRHPTSTSPFLVRRGEEGAFLASLPITLLPLSRDALRHLTYLGIRTIGEVAKLPLINLTTLDGKMGQLVHRLANGNDARPVVPRPSERREEIKRTFDEAIENELMLDELLSELGTQLAQRLVDETVRTFELTLTLHRGKTITARRTLSEPTTHSALIVRTLQRLKTSLSVETGVFGVLVRARDITPTAPVQLDLFGSADVTTYRLSDILDALLGRFDTHYFYEVEEREREHLALEKRFSFKETSAA